MLGSVLAAHEWQFVLASLPCPDCPIPCSYLCWGNAAVTALSRTEERSCKGGTKAKVLGGEGQFTGKLSKVLS